MITVVVRRVLPLVCVFGTLVALIRSQRYPEIGSDTYLHLRLGAEFLSGWDISSPGHLGVYDTERWYPTQWLAQIAMAAVEDLGGMGAVIWVAGMLALALPVALYLSARATAAPLPSAIAAVLGVLAAAPGLSARPQVVSYLLIAVVMSAWLATARDLKPRWWLIPLTWVWVPLHGMWVVGITIGVAAVAGLAIEHRHDRRLVLRLAAVPVLSAATALLTPLGLGVVRSVTMVGERNAQLTEWDPPDFTDRHAMVLAAMIAIVLVWAIRSPALDWPTVMLLGLAVAWAVYTTRTTIVAAVMITPLLAAALQRIVPTTSPPGRRELAALAAMLAAAGAVLAVVAAERSDERVVAGWVDERVEAMPEGTRVLNDWELGHYVLWRHPQVDLVMHGYVDVFTLDELERNIGVATLAPEWDREVAEIDADYALLDPDSRLGYELSKDPGWTVVEGDDDYVLLAPAAG